MPRPKVEYVPQPYVGPSRVDTSGYGRTLADLMYQRGQQSAAMHLQRGDNAARGWQQAGGAIAGAVDSWQRNLEQQRQQAIEQARETRRAEAEGMQLEASRMALERGKRQDKAESFTRSVLPMFRREDGLSTYDRDALAREFEAGGFADQLPEVFAKLDEQDAAHMKVLEARRDAVAADAFRLLQGGGADDDQTYASLLEYWRENDVLPKRELAQFEKLGKNPETRRQALAAAVQSSPRFAEQIRKMQEANAPKIEAVDPTRDLVDMRTGDVLRPGAPAEPKAPANLEQAILQATDPAERDRLIALKKDFAAAGRAPGAPPAAEPLVAITGPDGRPVLVPRSEAVGKAPANTREQGRQVTSGDAGDIAELNTALDDLATLKGELTGNGATGTSAQIGAALWTPITNLTGWGTEAKQKQAQIDRVKQVIGKALEGGVLRKEDEAKYEKILPTIKDSPELVRAKLNGLVAAIEKRHGRKLEALESAGYDVSRFTGAGAAMDGEGWQTVDGIRVRVKP